MPKWNRSRRSAVSLLATLAIGALATQSGEAKPNPAGPQRLPTGVTRMNLDDRMTQCHEMMPGMLPFIRQMEGPGPVVPHTGNDPAMRDMALAGLLDCRDLLNELIVRIERSKKMRRPSH